MNIWYDALLASSVVAARTYATIVNDDIGASEIFPFVNISSGTTIPAFVNSARNGTLLGLDLQNAAGPVAGTLAPYWDGTNDYGDILTSNGSTGLVDIFNGALGSALLWVKKNGSWASGGGGLLEMRVNNNNYVRLARNGANIVHRHNGGGTVKTVTANYGSPAGWFSTGLSWDVAGGEMKAYKDGAQIGTTQTALGTLTGTITGATIGAQLTTPSDVFDGWIAYAFLLFGAKWSDANFANIHAAAATAIGD